MEIQETNSYVKLENKDNIVRIISENLCNNENLVNFIREKNKENINIFYENDNDIFKGFNLLKLGNFFPKDFFRNLLEKYQQIFDDVFSGENLENNYKYIYIFEDMINNRPFPEMPLPTGISLPPEIKKYYMEKISEFQSFLEDTFYKKYYDENFNQKCLDYINKLSFDLNNLIFWKIPYSNIIIISDYNFNNYTKYFSDLGYNTLYYGIVDNNCKK